MPSHYTPQMSGNRYQMNTSNLLGTPLGFNHGYYNDTNSDRRSTNNLFAQERTAMINGEDLHNNISEPRHLDKDRSRKG